MLIAGIVTLALAGLAGVVLGFVAGVLVMRGRHLHARGAVDID